MGSDCVRKVAKTNGDRNVLLKIMDYGSNFIRNFLNCRKLCKRLKNNFCAIAITSRLELRPFFPLDIFSRHDDFLF